MTIKQMKKSVIFFLIVYNIFYNICNATSLSALVIQAVKNSPELKLGDQQYKQSELQLKEDRADFYPTIDVISSIGYENTETIPVDTSTASTLYELKPQEVGITASQNLYNGFQTINKLKQHQHDLAAKQFTYNDILNTIKYNTFEDAMAVISSQSTYNLDKKHLALAEKTYSIIYSKYKAGIGNQPDVSMALAMIDREKKKLSSSEINNLKARYLFKQRVGIDPPKKIEINKVPEEKLPSSLKELQEKMIRSSNRLEAAIAMNKSDEAAVAVEKGVFSPKVDLDLVYERSKAASGQDQTENHHAAIVTVSWNLFNGNADRANYHQAILKKMSSSTNVEYLRRQLSIEAINTWNAYNQNKNQLPIDLAEKKHTKEAYLGYRKQVSVGRKNISELLSAERNYIEADDNYLTQQMNLRENAYKLCELTGILPEIIK